MAIQGRITYQAFLIALFAFCSLASLSARSASYWFPFAEKTPYTCQHHQTERMIRIVFPEIESGRFKEAYKKQLVPAECVKRMTVSSTSDGGGTELSLYLDRGPMRVAVQSFTGPHCLRVGICRALALNHRLHARLEQQGGGLLLG